MKQTKSPSLPPLDLAYDAPYNQIAKYALALIVSGVLLALLGFSLAVLVGFAWVINLLLDSPVWAFTVAATLQLFLLYPFVFIYFFNLALKQRHVNMGK